MRYTTFAALAATALAEVHTVEVGEKGFQFDPQTVTAAVGDTVIFKFYASHDVAQASFDSPCAGSSNGFYSGPFSGTDGGKKKFVYTVNSTDPIWYYCTTGTHCASGMVGGINIATSGDKTIQAFADKAKGKQSQRPASLSGGQLEEDEQIASLTASSAPSATNSGSGSATTASNTASGTGSASTPSSTGLADNVKAPVTGVLAAILGFAAWAL